MIAKQFWEAAIGRIYTTFSGRRVRIIAVEGDVLVAQVVGEKDPLPYGWNFDGTCPANRTMDLMEMVRSSNTQK